MGSRNDRKFVWVKESTGSDTLVRLDSIVCLEVVRPYREYMRKRFLFFGKKVKVIDGGCHKLWTDRVYLYIDYPSYLKLKELLYGKTL